MTSQDPSTTPADRFREFALALPEVEERETWGIPTFRIKDKMFASLSSDGTQASIKATHEEQDALTTLQPETFKVAAYTGRFGWVSVDLTQIDRDHLEDLLSNGWRRTAPKKLVARYK
ncbi:MAG: MmcQ/YjbR family DNA-binding protein [Chloroflexota bacterium]